MPLIVFGRRTAEDEMCQFRILASPRRHRYTVRWLRTSEADVSLRRIEE
jgi:hypothetical protein